MYNVCINVTYKYTSIIYTDTYTYIDAMPVLVLQLLYVLLKVLLINILFIYIIKYIIIIIYNTILYNILPYILYTSNGVPILIFI